MSTGRKMLQVNFLLWKKEIQQINLLPWRRELRQIKKAQFLASWVLCIFVSLLILVGAHLHYIRAVNAQIALNTTLLAAIDEEAKSLLVLKRKENKTNFTEEKIKFITSLANGNYGLIRLLNKLVSMPGKMSIAEINKTQHKIIVSGITVSADDVNKLMKDISKPLYFNKPILLSMDEVANSKDKGKKFQMSFEQKG
jgi:Tfp pilus assembly protein PilN